MPVHSRICKTFNHNTKLLNTNFGPNHQGAWSWAMLNTLNSHFRRCPAPGRFRHRVSLEFDVFLPPSLWHSFVSSCFKLDCKLFGAGTWVLFTTFSAKGTWSEQPLGANSIQIIMIRKVTEENAKGCEPNDSCSLCTFRSWLLASLTAQNGCFLLLALQHQDSCGRESWILFFPAHY